MNNKLFDLGVMPPLGILPDMMWASCLRQHRYGLPKDAFQMEQVPVPHELSDHDVLVYVKAAGVNYNGIWAASGVPADVIQLCKSFGEEYDYFIPGSEASGIIWKKGAAVIDLDIGDEVIVSPMYWDAEDADIQNGQAPQDNPTYRVWGFEKNLGAFAQYTRVNAGQCIKKPDSLSWAEAAGGVGGIAFMYKMLCGQTGCELKQNDPVLIWGGAGNVGQNAIHICKLFNARPIVVVSNQEKYEYCKDLGAHGIINRANFTHWRKLPDFNDPIAYRAWIKEAKRFGNAFYDALGEKINPKIVVEHPGENTLPTSVFLAAQNGMIVTCGGTSGYYASLDLRYLWMRSKRLQGCHGFDAKDNLTALNLIEQNQFKVHLNRTFSLAETGMAHQMMLDNRLPSGNMAVTIN